MLLHTAQYDLIRNHAQFTESEPIVGVIDDLRVQCQQERDIWRYYPLVRGWCQAFGEHDNILLDNGASCWLIGKNQIGLVLTRPQIRHLNHEVLFQERAPKLTFSEQGVHIGFFFFPFKSRREKQVLQVIDRLFATELALHIYRTSHFLYGNGRRIITISTKRPAPILYRKIGIMNARLL